MNISNIQLGGFLSQKRRLSGFWAFSDVNLSFPVKHPVPLTVAFALPCLHSVNSPSGLFLADYNKPFILQSQRNSRGTCKFSGFSFFCCLPGYFSRGPAWLQLTGACFTWTRVLKARGLQITRLNVPPLCEREQVLVSVSAATVVSTWLKETLGVEGAFASYWDQWRFLWSWLELGGKRRENYVGSTLLTTLVLLDCKNHPSCTSGDKHTPCLFKRHPQKLGHSLSSPWVCYRVLLFVFTIPPFPVRREGGIFVNGCLLSESISC